ncbi:hypothetical protein ACFFJJ_12500 [Fictibacillus phosphorivorans]|jgi:hypothetical protein
MDYWLARKHVRARKTKRESVKTKAAFRGGFLYLTMLHTRLTAVTKGER